MGEHEWELQCSTCGHTQIKEDAKLSFCSTWLTLPRNVPFIVKDIVRDVHAVLVVPCLAHVTLGHFIALFLWQAAGTVKVHWLGVPDTNSPALTNLREARKTTFLQAICQVLPYRSAIIPDLAWVLTTTNIVGKCYGQNSTVRAIWLPSNVHHSHYELFSRTEH